MAPDNLCSHFRKENTLAIHLAVGFIQISVYIPVVCIHSTMVRRHPYSCSPACKLL